LGCTSQCDDSTPCPEGSSCVDNQCCTCSKEEFTLVLRNLTFEDSGRYKCQIANRSEQLEFQVEVLESGLKGGFHENISYDHSECCQEKGISPLCRAMCKPSEMAEHHFDPIRYNFGRNSFVRAIHSQSCPETSCTSQCDDSTPCPEGSSCVDNQCCTCSKEEFTLVLRNLTFEDSGRYKCQIANRSEQLEFQVEVLESGLKGGFHENISYDHSECCQEKGISPLCRAMCKPSEMAEHHFDPTSCKTDDYKNFLYCATENGTRSHIHCCKTQLVPSFCYDFCSGDFKMLRRSHRLCLYYLPEIFECYNRAYRMLANPPLELGIQSLQMLRRSHRLCLYYLPEIFECYNRAYRMLANPPLELPYPDPPEQVVVNAVEHDKLSVCWRPPPVHESNKNFPVIDYSVYYKEIPNFPLMGGDIGIPLLNGDYSEFGDLDDDTDYVDPDTTTEKPTQRTRREEKPRLSFGIRKKRDTVVSVLDLQPPPKQDSGLPSVLNLQPSPKQDSGLPINTTGTCQTISDLRSSTRYIVYVTSRNEYGTSVPSVRSIASTNIHTVKNNETLPDVMSEFKTVLSSVDLLE
ncbi:unnamed protein product, partial [Strongylus vulgaris]